jgi:hypothetical protein
LRGGINEFDYSMVPVAHTILSSIQYLA